jgi:hypothetical protein
MVNSITEIVQNLIKTDSALQIALQKKYANHSAVARLLKPSVEKILRKSVNIESLISSVKRTEVEYPLLQGKIQMIIAKSGINLRTNVAKISIEKTKDTLETTKKAISKWPQDFFQVLEGTSIITLIFHQKKFSHISKLFQKTHILDAKQNLAEIIINSPKEIIDTPGCALTFYNPVSMKRVNIEETMSCYTDTIIVLSNKDVGKAFIALTDLIEQAKNALAIFNY